MTPTYPDKPSGSDDDREHSINWVTNDTNCELLDKYVKGVHSKDGYSVTCNFWKSEQLLLGSYVSLFNNTFIKSPANRSEYRVLTGDMEAEYEKYKAYFNSEKYYLHFYDTEELLYALNIKLIRAVKLFFYKDGRTLDQQINALAKTLHAPQEISDAMNELVGQDSLLDGMLDILGVSVTECSDKKTSVMRLATVQSIDDDIRTVVEGCFKNAQLFFTGYPGVPQLAEVEDLLQITASLQELLSRIATSVVTAGDDVLNTDLTSAAAMLSSELGDQMFASLDVAALGMLLATLGVLGIGVGALFSIGQVDLQNTEKARARRYQVPQTDFEIASERQTKGVNDDIMNTKQ